MRWCAWAGAGSPVGRCFCHVVQDAGLFGAACLLQPHCEPLAFCIAHSAAMAPLAAINSSCACGCHSGVAGYPRVQHGGFSAAVMDECMGLLFYALRQHRQLPFVGPAFTAHLEVDYKKVKGSRTPPAAYSALCALLPSFPWTAFIG